MKLTSIVAVVAVMAGSTLGCAMETGRDGEPAPEEEVDEQVLEAVTVTALRNAFPRQVSGSAGSQKFFSLSVPARKTSVDFWITGGTGDADLYVRRGALPTLSTWDCRPYIDGNNESCSFGVAGDSQSGTWYVMLRGFLAYSNVSLTGVYPPGP